jgi:hypothetical protein
MNDDPGPGGRVNAKKAKHTIPVSVRTAMEKITLYILDSNAIQKSTRKYPNYELINPTWFSSSEADRCQVFRSPSASSGPVVSAIL